MDESSAESVHDTREELSRWLYIIAWIIEICAIIIGLSIGIWMVYSATVDAKMSVIQAGGTPLAGGQAFINGIVAFLPFLMVSVIEDQSMDSVNFATVYE